MSDDVAALLQEIRALRAELAARKEGPAKGVQGAEAYEELQLHQVRQIPRDKTKVESRSDVDLNRRFDFRNGQSLVAVPVIAANMFGVGTIPMAKVFNKRGMLVAMEKHTDVQSIISFLDNHDGGTAIPSIGFQKEDQERLQAIFDCAGKKAPHSIVVDVPNGHMEKMLVRIAELRRDYPKAIIIAGNVATGSSAKNLIEAGADVVKVGIGPGSACTTKLIAGTHRPQFAAVRECAEAVHPMGGYVVADGGVRTAGDVDIALAAGGDFVMIGGAFAAHDQSGEPIYIDENGKRWQEFMGSSSAAYMQRTKGEIAHYRAAEGELQWLPYKGPIEADGAILQEIEGGLRSALSYAGAHTLAEFAEMAKATYLGQSSGLILVKAAIDSGGSKASPGRIIEGYENPVTRKKPDEKLIKKRANVSPLFLQN